MDFGIAKQGGSRRARADAARRVRRHRRLRGARADRGEGDHERADIYAFGGVLYEALTGQKPYVRDTDVAVMFAHITEPPPAVSKVAADLPEALDAVIARAMAKSPAERFPTCREMIEAARAALGGSRGSAISVATALLADAPPAAGGRRRTCRCSRRRSSGATTSSRRSSRCSTQPAARLVTLTGLGGTGKTRLALEAATTFQDEYARGLLRRPLARAGSGPRRFRDRGRARRPRGAEPPAGGRDRRAPGRPDDADRARPLRAGARRRRRSSASCSRPSRA